MVNMDQRIRVEIIKQALRAPISCIAKNAGEEGAVIVGELLKEGVAVELGFNEVVGVGKCTDVPTATLCMGWTVAASIIGRLAGLLVGDGSMEFGVIGVLNLVLGRVERRTSKVFYETNANYRLMITIVD